MWTLSFAVALGAPPAVDLPLRTGASSGDAAVVIGIEDYAFVPDVPFAQHDADAFGDLLVYTLGLAPERVRRLRGANREQVLRAVAAAGGEVSEGGRLWIYFAGHGAASAADGSRMLLGIDVTADPQVFAERAVTVQELAGAAAAPTFMVLDTCYSGVGRGGDELAGGTRFAVPTSVLGTDGISWTAASASQLSAPLPAAEHGAFTYFVLGALRGWADGEVDGQRDGAVTLREADLYVARMLRQVGLPQQPELAGGTGAAQEPVSPGNEPAPDLSDVDWQAPAVESVVAPTGCRWPRVDAVSASLTTATVNGETYVVRGREHRASFSALLQTCGYDDSAAAFERWRKARRGANTFAAYPPLLWLYWIPAGKASKRRVEFEEALRQGR